MYSIYEMIGNFFAKVAEFDTMYEVQDYFDERLNAADINPDDESEVELFYSYFSIERV